MNFELIETKSEEISCTESKNTQSQIPNLPPFILSSKLYLDLDGNIYDIKPEFIVFDMPITDFNSFVKFLKILNYWKVVDYPDIIYDYIFSNSEDIDYEFLEKEFSGKRNFKLIHHIEIILFNIDADLSYEAGFNGYLNLLKYLHKCKNLFYADQVFYGMAASGNCYNDCLEYAKKNVNLISKNTPSIEFGWDAAIDQAVARNNLKTLKFLHSMGAELGFSLFSELTFVAIETNSYKCFEYLVKNKVPLHEKITSNISSIMEDYALDSEFEKYFNKNIFSQNKKKKLTDK
jgi:hypothetical protein